MFGPEGALVPFVLTIVVLASAIVVLWSAGSAWSVVHSLCSRGPSARRAARDALDWLAFTPKAHRDERSVTLLREERAVTIGIDASFARALRLVVLISGSVTPAARLAPLREGLRALGVERVTLVPEGVRLETRSLAASLGAVPEAERLLRIVDRAIELDPLLDEALLVRERASEAPRCPYCHDDVRVDRATCARCGALHHGECLAEHGTCAVFGCGLRT